MLSQGAFGDEFGYAVLIVTEDLLKNVLVVLAEHRRAALDPRRCARQFEAGIFDARLAQRRMGYLDEMSPMLQLGIAVHVARILNRVSGHAKRLQRFLSLLRLELVRPFTDDAIEFLAMR